MTTFHQVFALDASGTPVSIDQVPRGLACNCTCRACGTALVARQGDIRAWSFAHTANADCASAAESALHKAAKKVLLESTALLVPAITLKRSVRIPDGRTGSATATRPSGSLRYHQAEGEKACGSVRPDITLSTDFGDVFIEIVVTNALDREKRSKLITLGIATLELTLLLPRVVAGGTAWDALRVAVLGSLANKKWLIDLEKDRLSDEATAAARNTAEWMPVPIAEPVTGSVAESVVARTTQHQAVPPPQPVGRNKFAFGHTTLSLREMPFGIVASTRSADFAVDPFVPAWLARWGGRFNSKRQNWVFPSDKMDRLREVLAQLEVRINNETPYARHQRVLKEYNRLQDSN